MPSNRDKLPMAASAASRRPASGRRDPVAVVQDVHGLLAWLLARVQHFPRDIKQTLGHRLIETGLDLLEALVEAAYLPRERRVAALDGANRLVERLRHLCRLAHTAGALPHGSYGHSAELLDNIGRQVGGWRRAELPGRAAPAPVGA